LGAVTQVQREARSERQARARRVLVVEDDRLVAESMLELLRAWAYDVRLATTAPAALELVPTFRPDVVLLDLSLPGMDGLELARTLRARPAATTPVLIALTGYGEEQDRAASRAAGIDHHLVKPVEIDELRRLLARLE
jgi:CheY-like chemotaxis protein